MKRLNTLENFYLRQKRTTTGDIHLRYIFCFVQFNIMM